MHKIFSYENVAFSYPFFIGECKTLRFAYSRTIVPIFSSENVTFSYPRFDFFVNPSVLQISLIIVLPSQLFFSFSEKDRNIVSKEKEEYLRRNGYSQQGIVKLRERGKNIILELTTRNKQV